MILGHDRAVGRREQWEIAVSAIATEEHTSRLEKIEMRVGIADAFISNC